MPSRRIRQGPPRPPSLPDSLPAAVGVQLELEYEQAVESAAYDDVDLSGSEAGAVEFGQCRFRKASLAGSHLAKVRFIDCYIEISDMSNMRGEKGVLERVAVTGSRMTGLAWNDGLLADATFADCKVDLTNFRFARFDVVTFTDCNLAGADFTDADLRGASFTRCDLTRAQFHNATMTGTRFRACELEGIGGLTSWAGAIVHPDDLLGLSYALAGALGITVAEPDR
ncbi:pentapeptide repeat-containing protein [Paractinoplanes globisporus]|uniref:Pentapeptide repeat-containing protein n=1 Tax=Paractinoplanes globisporus TaxID=113565 RepID=A0ABW6W834_9ACTN|nr:pentapeptide repeat-containing protein [Actinoplanes globisporus]